MHWKVMLFVLIQNTTSDSQTQIYAFPFNKSVKGHRLKGRNASFNYHCFSQVEISNTDLWMWEISWRYCRGRHFFIFMWPLFNQAALLIPSCIVPIKCWSKWQHGFVRQTKTEQIFIFNFQNMRWCNWRVTSYLLIVLDKSLMALKW